VYTDVTAGLLHSCGLVAGGAVWCWGANSSGQLGDSSFTQRTSPVQVYGSGTAPFKFATISAGGEDTCGINASGVAYCWGEPTNGALGDGDAATTKIIPNPVSNPVAGAVTYKTATGSISVGKQFGTHVCAIVTDARLFCWGRGSNGQQGNGSIADQLVPLQGGGSLLFTAIATGAYHTCGVVTPGNVPRCWGNNGSGQLGDATIMQQNTPVLVITTETFTSFAAGDSHSCALTADGRGFCWGFNGSGQLGNGNQSAQSTPVGVKQR